MSVRATSEGAYDNTAGQPRGQVPTVGSSLAASPLEFSWVVGSNWLPHQRRELENDLIAAHMGALEKPPVAQFAS